MTTKEGNPQYKRGRAYEYKIAKKLRDEGWIVLRTAGSHGLFDLIAIRTDGKSTKHCERCQCDYYEDWYDAREIKLIQCKSGKSAKREIKKVLDSDIKKYEGLYSVSVEAL